MKYDYLLFDLDGTLVDTLRGVVISAQYALAKYGIHRSLEELRPFLGPPLRFSFMNFVGLSEAQAVEAIGFYREKYNEIALGESKLFDGIPELLDKLISHGYILGVATSKYEEYAVIMLSYFNIADKFEYITGSNLDESISSKEQVIEEALRRFGISGRREKALMIGDMKYDDIGAAKAGIDSLGIYTGTASPGEHEKAGAVYIAHSFEEAGEMLTIPPLC